MDTFIDDDLPRCLVVRWPDGHYSTERPIDDLTETAPVTSGASLDDHAGTAPVTPGTSPSNQTRTAPIDYHGHPYITVQDPTIDKYDLLAEAVNAEIEGRTDQDDQITKRLIFEGFVVDGNF